MKGLYRCDSVVISSFVRTGYTTRRWGWLLGRIGYSIYSTTHRYSTIQHYSTTQHYTTLQHYATLQHYPPHCTVQRWKLHNIRRLAIREVRIFWISFKHSQFWYNSTSTTTSWYSMLTHCGRVTQICVFNTVKLGTSASSPLCHSTRRKVSRGITPSSNTRVFGEYFLRISVHKNS